MRKSVDHYKTTNLYLGKDSRSFPFPPGCYGFLYRETEFLLRWPILFHFILFISTVLKFILTNVPSLPLSHRHASIQYVLRLSLACKYKYTLYSFSDIWYLHAVDHKCKPMHTLSQMEFANFLFYFERSTLICASWHNLDCQIFRAALLLWCVLWQTVPKQVAQMFSKDEMKQQDLVYPTDENIIEYHVVGWERSRCCHPHSFSFFALDHFYYCF